MSKLKALWELMRLEHGVMIAVAILIGSVIAAQQVPSFKIFLFTFCTALFLEASTFALNDFYDIDIDKKNKRNDRPLARGDLSPKTALGLFFVLFPLGIICSYFVNLTCFFIALITALFAIMYDVILKKIKLVGNFFIAYTMAIPFIFGGAAVLQESGVTLTLSPGVFIITLIAFLAGSGREIMKDVMDFSGDRQQGVTSFPTYLGIQKSQRLAALFFIAAVILSFLPFISPSYAIYYQNYYYLGTVLMTDCLLIYTSVVLFLREAPQLIYHRKLTLVALMIGLIAFLLGAFTG